MIMKWKLSRRRILFIFALITFFSTIVIMKIFPNREKLIEDFLNSNTTAMDDPDLVKTIRDEWLENPSVSSYNLNETDRIDYSRDQRESLLLDEIMGSKTNGFFIECGARDGEDGAISLLFEKSRSWNGLLVEANPTYFETLLSKHRKAFAIRACASVTKHPQKVRFQKANGLGGIEFMLTSGQQRRIDIRRFRGDVVIAQCFPIYTMLLALGLPRVDLFVLDVEGAEVAIFKTIPFEKVDIRLIYVERNEGEAVGDLLRNNGYEFIKHHKKNSIYRKKIQTK